MKNKEYIKAYIAFGSNSEPECSRKNALDCALNSILRLPVTNFISKSCIYESIFDPGDLKNETQPDYKNAVMCVETGLSASALLGALLGIEAAMYRVRKERNSARIIDLDLLLYGNLIIQTAELTLPHPRMFDRAFVLEPLSELLKNEKIEAARKIINKKGILSKETWN